MGRRLGYRGGFSGVVALLIVFSVTSLGAQQQPAPPQPSQGDAQSGTATLQVQSQLVLVPTTVSTARDGILYDLKASQFLVEDNGVRQRVRLDDGDESTRPLSLVVVVQCSRDAEMEFDKFRGLATMIDAIAGGAPAEVAVIQFGTGEELMTGFTSDPDARDRALHKLAPCDYDGGANIFDAVDYANTILEAHHAQGRRAVLLISETRDHGSETKPETVIQELGRSNTVVDAVAFSPGRDEVTEDLKHGGGGGLISLIFMAVQAVRMNAPKEFARLSGGEYINFATQKGFDQGMSTLANHVHNYYLLSFQPRFPTDAAGASAGAAGLHRITVKVPDYPSAIIQHRESYWDGGPNAATPPQ